MTELSVWWMAMGYKFFVEDFRLPEDFTTAISYAVVFLVSWYVVLYVARFLMALLWPVMIVVSALFIVRFLRTFDPVDLVDIFLQAVELIIDTALELCSNFYQDILETLNHKWAMLFSDE